MKNKFRLRISVVVFLAVAALMAGCSVSLASDITPPPDSQTFNASTTQAPVDQADLPIVAPDAQNGKVVYEEKCAPCHGVTGMGDGAQSSNLSVEVPALGDSTVARGVRPVEWYNMVTDGNIERFMPPFKSLDDRTRWDVVAYALTLSVDDQTVADGKAIYEANCAQCHGENGEGSSQASGWRDDPGLLAQTSIFDMAAVISTGRGNMPSFSSTLDEGKINSVASYIRWMGYNGGGESAQAAATTEPSLAETAAATADAVQPVSGTITISGQVTNASGGELPAGLSVTLLAYDGMTEAFTDTAAVDAGGRYHFDDVENSDTRTFMTMVEYNGVPFTSEAYHSADQPSADLADMPINIYDTTTDLSALKVDRMHIFFDFTKAGYIQVAELFVLNNTGSQVITSAEANGPVVNYDLPAGATNLQFQEGMLGERYLPTENGFADTQNIAPGSGMQLLFAFDLPYNKSLNVDIPIPLDVDSAVVMVPKGTLTIQSDQVQPMGTSDVQGANYDFYAATNLTAGSALALKLSGSTGLGGSASLSTSILIGAIVLALALIGAFTWFLIERRRVKRFSEQQSVHESPDTEEGLMDAIIALDDRYQAGELSAEAYEARRAELKERLKKTLGA
jgi:mono/diheme cytochrome c family protein